MPEPTDTSIDKIVGFTIPGHNARGRIVRLGPVLDQILANHAYPDVIERTVSEAVLLTALMGSTLKPDEGQLTLQAQTEVGIIDLLVSDYVNGDLRGYARYDEDKLAESGPTPSLFALFGRGYLALTFDMSVTSERYQGIVPLEGESLADAADYYFTQSEQIPTLIKIAIHKDADGRHQAGGLLVQYLPEGEVDKERIHVREATPGWDHVSALAATVKDSELTDNTLALEHLLWRLFNEDEVHVLPDIALNKGCRCTLNHYETVLSRFGQEDRNEMADERGLIVVDCAFCHKKFEIVATI